MISNDPAGNVRSRSASLPIAHGLLIFRQRHFHVEYVLGAIAGDDDQLFFGQLGLRLGGVDSRNALRTSCAAREWRIDVRWNG